jgi:hypothetical protein
LIRSKLQDEHRKLVDQDLATAAAASGQEQLEANYIIYRDYPSELLPKTFVKEQETLQATRKADALKALDIATKLASSRRGNLKFPARKEFQKVLDMKLFLPTEAARAESLMRGYGLTGN